MHLEHVNFTVSDLDRSLAFYRRLLDLDLRWRSGPERPEPAAHLGRDGFYIAMFQASKSGMRRPRPDYDSVGLNHFGFVVDDLDAARERLAALGVSPHQEADYEPGRRLYFFDPDGIEVELVAYGANETPDR